MGLLRSALLPFLRVPGDGLKLKRVKAAMEQHAGSETNLIVVEVMVAGRNMIVIVKLVSIISLTLSGIKYLGN